MPRGKKNKQPAGKGSSPAAQNTATQQADSNASNEAAATDAIKARLANAQAKLSIINERLAAIQPIDLSHLINQSEANGIILAPAAAAGDAAPLNSALPQTAASSSADSGNKDKSKETSVGADSEKAKKKRHRNRKRNKANAGGANASTADDEKDENHSNNEDGLAEEKEVGKRSAVEIKEKLATEIIPIPGKDESQKSSTPENQQESQQKQQQSPPPQIGNESKKNKKNNKKKNSSKESPPPVEPPLNATSTSSTKHEKDESVVEAELKAQSTIKLVSESTVKVEATTESDPKVKAEPTIDSELAVKAAPKIKTEPKVKTEPKIKSEPKIKAEATIISEPKVKTESAIKSDPALKAEPKVETEPAIKSEPAKKAEPKVKTEPAIKSEPALKAEPKVKTEPTIKSEPATKAEPKVKTESAIKSEPALKAEPKVKTEPAIKSEPALKAEQKVQTEPAIKSEPALKAEPKVKTEPAIKSEPPEEAGPKIKSEPKVKTEPANKSEPALKAEPKVKTEPAIKSQPPEEAGPKMKSEPKVKTEPAVKSDPVVTTKSEAIIKSEAKVKTDITIKSEPSTKSEPKIITELTIKSEPEADVVTRTKSAPTTKIEPTITAEAVKVPPVEENSTVVTNVDAKTSVEMPAIQNVDPNAPNSSRKQKKKGNKNVDIQPTLIAKPMEAKTETPLKDTVSKTGGTELLTKAEIGPALGEHTIEVNEPSSVPPLLLDAQSKHKLNAENVINKAFAVAATSIPSPAEGIKSIATKDGLKEAEKVKPVSYVDVAKTPAVTIAPIIVTTPTIIKLPSTLPITAASVSDVEPKTTGQIEDATPNTTRKKDNKSESKPSKAKNEARVTESKPPTDAPAPIAAASVAALSRLTDNTKHIDLEELANDGTSQIWAILSQAKQSTEPVEIQMDVDQTLSSAFSSATAPATTTDGGNSQNKVESTAASKLLAAASVATAELSTLNNQLLTELTKPIDKTNDRKMKKMASSKSVSVKSNAKTTEPAANEIVVAASPPSLTEPSVVIAPAAGPKPTTQTGQKAAGTKKVGDTPKKESEKGLGQKQPSPPQRKPDELSAQAKQVAPSERPLPQQPPAAQQPTSQQQAAQKNSPLQKQPSPQKQQAPQSQSKHKPNKQSKHPTVVSTQPAPSAAAIAPSVQPAPPPDTEIPLDISIISSLDSATATISALDDSISGASNFETIAVTDSKNVQGSDFVPSAEPQSVAAAKSLSIQPTNNEADQSKTVPIPTVDNAAHGLKATMAPSLTANASPNVEQSAAAIAPAPNHAGLRHTAPGAPNCTILSAKSQPNSKSKPKVPPKPAHLIANANNVINNRIGSGAKKPTKKPPPPPPSDEDEEDFFEYKFTPRQVFICTICQTCKDPLINGRILCPNCQMVSYCSEEHSKNDAANHKDLCMVIQEIAKKRGGHVYNNARILNDDDYRSLRVHTLNICENLLKRPLQTFEREILLFPRLCSLATCREWRQLQLIECKICEQASHCIAHTDHLPANHHKWCKAYNLYQKLVITQKKHGRIEADLPSKIMTKPYVLPGCIDDVFKDLYRNVSEIQDECVYVTLTQLATAPLTAFFAAQKCDHLSNDLYTIHLVGAELQFEAEILDKWEAFFLHLTPKVMELRVVFIGPELNAEHLPLEILSRIRMCRMCRQQCRVVKFDFQCGKLYVDYVQSPAFIKPNLVCFFNPGLYRTTGFNGADTWPASIKAATNVNCPIVVTSYTELESPRDLERLQRESSRPLDIVHGPQVNAFSAQRPERNFISDEVAPMIFKNFYIFIVK